MTAIRTPDDERPDWLYPPVNRTSAFPYNDAISSVRRVCS